MFRTLILLLFPAIAACQLSRSPQASSILKDDSDNPYFTCETPDLDIKVYASFVVINQNMGGASERRQQHYTTPMAFASRTDETNFRCGSEAESLVIKVFSDVLQVGYKATSNAESLEWLQYQMGAADEVATPPDDSQNTDPTFDPTWQEAARTNYSIFYKSGSEADRDAMDDHMAHAVAASKLEFSQHEPQSILDEIQKFDVYLHPAPTPLANDGLALLQFLDALGRQSQLHFLAPSAHPPGSRPNMNSYIRKTVMHEYVTVFLVQIVHMKSGWRDVYSAPGWFVQGYQEYMGLLHGDDYSRDVTLKSYTDQFKANRDRIKISADGIAVANDYFDGTVLLHFFYSKFGKERTHKVLTSARTSFSEALRTELGSYAEIAAEFAAWSDSL